MNRRLERLNDQIREEIGLMLLHEVRDPRLEGRLVSITHVDVSPDLYNARVSFSVMGTPREQEDAQKALTAAAAFFHRELKARLEIRRVPFLEFRRDTSLEEGARMLEILAHVQHDDEAGIATDTTPPQP
jgi:ribosome-binding factor A